MDDALNSNPDRFRMLRAMWKVSLLKWMMMKNSIDGYYLKRNEEDLLNKKCISIFEKSHNQIRIKIQNKIS